MQRRVPISEPHRAVNGDASPNGHDEPNPTATPHNKRRLTQLDCEIIEYDAAHPEISLDHLRKRFSGRSKADIAELLGRTP